jgi:PEP-CTERM motif
MKIYNQVFIKLSVIVLLAFLFSCGSAFGIVITSTQEGFDIEPSTTYDLLLPNLPTPASGGILTVTEHYGDFNNCKCIGTVCPRESVNVDIDSIVLGVNIFFACDNQSNARTLDVSFNLTYAQMTAIATDSQAIVHVTTSPDVDNSLAGSWFQASISYEPVPEPTTLLLFGLGGLMFRKQK